MTADTSDLASHFAFGENWESYSRLIDAEKIGAAVKSMSGFVGTLDGRSVLDIGCGSGLSSLAALKLGAGFVMAIDIDPKSVETTQKVLSRFSPSDRWRIEAVSVLSKNFDQLGQFDVVYSWGVLHHTGVMRQAIEKAATKVNQGGLLAIAIYRKTVLCGAWRIEKRVYKNSPRYVQDMLFWLYKSAMRVSRLIKGKRQSGRPARGMDVDHDIRDWLGGYPYESATPAEIDAIVVPLGFRCIKREAMSATPLGLSGSGCAEFLYQRL